jgi:tRNA methyl transferase
MFELLGHYATLQPTVNGLPALTRGVDPVKDQSYFLCRVRRENLDRVRASVASSYKLVVILDFCFGRCCYRWECSRRRKCGRWRPSFACQLPQEKTPMVFASLGNENSQVCTRNATSAECKSPSLHSAEFLSEYIVTTPGHFCDVDTGEKIGKNDAVVALVVVSRWRFPQDGVVVPQLPMTAVKCTQ